jgi:hypothetical protein
MSQTFIKDVDAVLDYGVDWSIWLESGDTISSSTWTITPSSITTDSTENTTTQAKIWLSGGTVGTTYTATNRIVTNEGRTQDQSIYIKVVHK